MMGEQRRLHRFAELRAGVGVAVHPPLLEHHVALRRDDVVGEGQARHAVGFERHAGLKVLLGDLLEIGGEIVAGEGVLHAPTSETNSENSPLGWRFVPLNIRCSRKWAMPDLPGGSSAAPLRYQTM